MGRDLTGVLWHLREHIPPAHYGSGLVHPSRRYALHGSIRVSNVPASAYTGLAANKTYYVYDIVTGTYWAGAALVPSSSSTRAQVSVQDDGSYLLFSRPANGTWKAEDVGLSGIGGTTCNVTVPAAVLAIWKWAPGTCRAPNS